MQQTVLSFLELNLNILLQFGCYGFGEIEEMMPRKGKPG